jgi:dihydroxyacetone kinase phosphoprotein-dependent L subunit
MLKKIDIRQAKELLMLAAHRMVECEAELCRLDSYVGDGDHGVTVKRGFSKVLDELSCKAPATLADLFGLVGKTLSSNMGGASGPIFGILFSEAGRLCAGKQTLELCDFAGMFDAGLQGICRLGNAHVGDRTMVDALYPAVAALKATCESCIGLPDAFRLARDAAQQGAEHTREMLPKKGRARFLGEKALGHLDAGAMSVVFLFTAFQDFLSEVKCDEEAGERPQLLD